MTPPEVEALVQRADVRVAAILLIGNSPYHMGVSRPITLSLETTQRVLRRRHREPPEARVFGDS